MRQATDAVFCCFLKVSEQLVYDSAFHSNRQLEAVMLTRNLLMFLSDTAFSGPHSLEHLNTDRNNKYVLYASDKS